MLPMKTYLIFMRSNYSTLAANVESHAAGPDCAANARVTKAINDEGDRRATTMGLGDMAGHKRIANRTRCVTSASKCGGHSGLVIAQL